MVSQTGNFTQPLTESTQPFSNQEEFDQRVNQHIAVGGASASPVPLASPAALEVAEVTKAFKAASLASLPDARLILAAAVCLEGKASPAVIRLPHKVGSWNVVGVVQHAHDVNFTVCIPFYDPQVPDVARRARLIPHHLRVQIYYNPANNICALKNNGGADFTLVSLHGSLADRLVESGNAVAVPSGMWRILIGGPGSREQHLIDFLILRRSFTVSLLKHLPLESLSSKRSSSSETREGQGPAFKRRKADTDIVEVLIAPVEVPADSGLEAKVSRDVQYTQKSILSHGSPLLDLDGLDIAIVSTEQPAAPTFNNCGLDGPIQVQPLLKDSTDSYQLTRLQYVANTASASVFVGRHSRLSDNVVAKIIKYSGGGPGTLVKWANLWFREKAFLERLDNKNIMSLKAFDGRVFALYLERLPESLYRATDSPFDRQDARIILRGISSGLQYLKAQGICHNDIKPANIAYSTARGAVLLDFGLASSDEDSSKAGGTPWYIPPEAKQKLRGFPGDVWALGVTMLYVLAKIPLPERSYETWVIANIRAKGSTASEVMEKWLGVIDKARQSLDTHNVVERVVHLTLTKAPNVRINAAEMVAALEAGDVSP